MALRGPIYLYRSRLFHQHWPMVWQILGYIWEMGLWYKISNYQAYIKDRHGPLTRYTKLRVVHAPGMPGTFPRHRLQRKPLVRDAGMHHGTWVMHVPWCMSGSLIRGGGENVPGIPGACTTRNLHISQELKKSSCDSLMIGQHWCR